MIEFASVEKPEDLLGDVVIPKYGRDAGRTAVLIGWLSNGFALLADGERRSLSKPKKKNIAHLEFTNIRPEELHIKLSKGENVTDQMIREGLAAYGEQIGVKPSYGKK